MQPTTTNTSIDAPPSETAVEALYATGHWLYCSERPADAATVFRAMLLCNPNDERGWLALGACHEVLEQLDVALELYARGCRLAAPAPRCLLARARVLRMRGDRDGANAEMAKAEQVIDALGDETLRAILEAERRKS